MGFLHWLLTYNHAPFRNGAALARAGHGIPPLPMKKKEIKRDSENIYKHNIKDKNLQAVGIIMTQNANVERSKSQLIVKLPAVMEWFLNSHLSNSPGGIQCLQLLRLPSVRWWGENVHGCVLDEVDPEFGLMLQRSVRFEAQSYRYSIRSQVCIYKLI